MRSVLLTNALASILMLAVFMCATHTAEAAGKKRSDNKQDYLILYPKERARHQRDIDDRSIAYRERGQDYVNHLYKTGGEEDMPDNSKMYDLDNPITPRKVSVDDVAKIVKDTMGDDAGVVDSSKN